MKTAVILFNLGGPDNLKAVKPFLFNLFSDPAIIRLPDPFRFLLAKWLSYRRKPEASKIYQYLRGSSPITFNTRNQARDLQRALGKNYKVFLAMRYWHPRALNAFSEVKNYEPDHVILLPLYPQFSSTTTGSSFKEWEEVCKQQEWSCPTFKVCCYPVEHHFIKTMVRFLEYKLSSFNGDGKVRVLFSAHGLPQHIINQGDPYQLQVEATVKAILKQLDKPEIDYVICYQSRVGPLKWLEPSTESEIKRAGFEKVSVIVVPVSFVSEHSETLYELDVEYKKLALEEGVRHYERVPAVSVDPFFIEGLASLVKGASAQVKKTCEFCSNF